MPSEQSPVAASGPATPSGWEVEGRTLHLKAGSQRITPTAEEVYALVFEDSSFFRGERIALAPEPSDPSFSRYPARLIVRIVHDAIAPGAGLLARLEAAAGERFVAIPAQDGCDHVIIDGRWYPLAPGALDLVRQTLAGSGVGLEPSLSLRQYLDLRKLSASHDWIIDETTGREGPPGQDVERSEADLISFRGQLYPYQRSGWQWLTYVWQEGLGAILADEMGLGKTIQIIALLASPERDAAAPSLIVAPGTLLENWRREIAKFAGGLKTVIHQGADRSGDYRTLHPYDVVITSYDTVVRDGSMFRMIDWRIVILDEAQAIKNPDTKRTRAVKELRRRTGIAVTGTPLENRLRDLWSLTDFAIPGYLGTIDEFEHRFADDEGGAAALEPLISPIMLRRLVNEVAKDLPERINIPQALTLSEDEAQTYEMVRQQTLAEYGGSAALVALGRLRMFCAHPMLLDDAPWSLEQAAGFTKTRRLFEIVDEVFARRQKILVFTSYNRMADLIVRIVRQRYGTYADVINGSTPVAGRQDVVDRFSEEAGPALLALNPKAAGAGLNITAATHVVHYNLEWNPAVEDQASARAHRRGQTRPVTVHRLYFADCVEDVVNDRLARKRGLAEAAVAGVDGSEADRADIAAALHRSPVASTAS